MKAILRSPAIYQLYQELGGFFGARVTAITQYLHLTPGARVIDIGCGPGYIRKYLPDDIDYIGFDIDRSSIDYARAKFGGRGRFICGLFDAAAAAEYGPADIVMMNGVMHHIDDIDLSSTLAHIATSLRPGGTLFTLDGCYTQKQSRIARWLLDNDRGTFVRDETAYRRVLEQTFKDVTLHIHDDLSRLPYTFVIGLAHDPAAMRA